MFGYIRPYKPRMEISDYELYKASYCGLCKELKKFGITSRMTLSYDFAFLLILYMAVNETEISLDKKACIAHPLKKREFVKSCDALTFTATAECISVYHKLKDDISDDGFMKKAAAKTLLSGMKKPYKKAKKLLPELSSLTEEKMNLVHFYDPEAENTFTVDLDLNTDFYNAGHVNFYGAQKFTKVFGDYLVENYNLADHRKDEHIKENWDGVHERLLVKIAELEEARRLRLEEANEEAAE